MGLYKRCRALCYVGVLADDGDISSDISTYILSYISASTVPTACALAMMQRRAA